MSCLSRDKYSYYYNNVTLLQTHFLHICYIFLIVIFRYTEWSRVSGTSFESTWSSQKYGVQFLQINLNQCKSQCSKSVSSTYIPWDWLCLRTFPYILQHGMIRRHLFVIRKSSISVSVSFERFVNIRVNQTKLQQSAFQVTHKKKCWGWWLYGSLL